MDAIIAKILEIERRSCELVREAEEKRDTLDETLDAKQEELKKAIFSGEEKRLENDKVLILNKARSEAREQEEYAKEKIAAMDAGALYPNYQDGKGLTAKRRTREVMECRRRLFYNTAR